MKITPGLKSEQWKYIFSIFPFIDLPFNILAIYLSKNWMATLSLAIAFPLIATTILKFCEKSNAEPGPWILSINGALCILYFYVSGPGSPTWLSLINVTVGASFMFNNPKIGQFSMAVFSLFTGWFFYYMGADTTYSLIIALTLLAFVVLFSRAYAFMQHQQNKIEIKNKEVEEQKKEIISSINYAKRIQQAVLPQEENIYRNIPLSFILYKPKDIVSGDFYWFHEIDRDNYIIACADCTGHGVPGALMTVIGSNLLNQTVIDNKLLDPSQILLVLDNLINQTLKQQKEHEHIVQDGMDVFILKVDKLNKEFTFASAKRPAIFIRNKEIIEYKGSKYSLGGTTTGSKIFNETKVKFQEDDMIYLFTDGCTDQFGGEKGKKYSIQQLRELLLNIHMKKPGDQKQLLDNAIEHWKRNHEQIDDMLLIGIKF